MIKIANIVGARPQFIKYFPVTKAIEKWNYRSGNMIRDILIHTGQHYDYNMSKIFFDEFGIREPDYHLEVGSGLHGKQTGEILRRVEEVLLKEKPDFALVYGDTNSTLGGALAAAKIHVPVAHVESGLRSYNKEMPEEINRVLTDHISSILFCPSETAVKNLQREGFKHIINNGKLVKVNEKLPHKESKRSALLTGHTIIINVGDVMYDVLLHAVKIAEKQSSILRDLGLEEKDFYLLTLHRAENTDNKKRLENIIEFVNEISADKIVIFPMHPRTKKSYKNTRKKLPENVRIVEPVSYFDMLMLLKNSELIMTDSGGMQKEAYWLKIPCITLRDETEWIETVKSGWNILFKNYKGAYKPSGKNELYYGDGKGAERIINILIKMTKKEKNEI